MDIVKAEFVMSNSNVEKCPVPDRHEYAFIGRSNVGKSSLINMLPHRLQMLFQSLFPLHICLRIAIIHVCGQRHLGIYQHPPIIRIHDGHIRTHKPPLLIMNQMIAFISKVFLHKILPSFRQTGILQYPFQNHFPPISLRLGTPFQGTCQIRCIHPYLIGRLHKLCNPPLQYRALSRLLMISLINLLTESLVTESDRPEYEIKLDIRYTDINLEETAFTMYYNQTRILDDDDWEDRFDDEEEYRIDGIVLLDGNEYTIRGEKEKEEDEMELAFWCFLDEGSYVHVKQEKERDESEFEYEIYQGGRKVHAYSLEQEDGEVELKLLDRENHDYTEMKFVDFQKEGKYYILAKLDNDRLYFQKNDDGTYSEARI